MHPRNIYKNKPNFADLASQYTDLQQFLIPSPHCNTKVTIDFGNPIALKTLTQALFKCHWNLNVQLPDNRLIPAIPQRLNYILWIEDLVNELIDINCKSNISTVTGIDIGTGASCVFPLLICRKNPSWHMMAFESDSFSTQIALSNLSLNQLTRRVTLVNTSEWFSYLIQQKKKQFDEPSVTSNAHPHYHFIICNPPFFSSSQPLTNVNGSCDQPCELEVEMEDPFDGLNDSNGESRSSFKDPQSDSSENVEKRTQNRVKKSGRKKSSANTSCQSDSVTFGGEIEFVKRLILQSVELSDLVDIFTVMLGCKQSLISLKQELVKVKNENDQLTFNWTQFCQGRVVRWGLVWSFSKNLTSNSINRICSHKLPKKSSELSFELPSEVIADGLDVVSGWLDILVDVLVQDLNIKTFTITKLTSYSSTIVVKSNVNTWSHQRRKRRQLQKQQKEQQLEQQKESSQLNQLNCHQLHPQHGQDTLEDEMVIETTQGIQGNAEKGTKSSKSINNSLNHSNCLSIETVASASSATSASTFRDPRKGQTSEYSCCKRKVDETDSFNCHFDGTNDKVTRDILTSNVHTEQLNVADGQKSKVKGEEEEEQEEEDEESFAQQKTIAAQIDAKAASASVPLAHTWSNISSLSHSNLTAESNFTTIAPSSDASYCNSSKPSVASASSSTSTSYDCNSSKRLKDPIYSERVESSVKNKEKEKLSSSLKCQQLKGKKKFLQHHFALGNTNTDDILYLLHCTMKITKSIDGSIKLIVQSNENSLDHEATYQIFQFMKNRLTSIKRPI